MEWEALLRQKNIVFLGEAGCGKSELAVHLALELASQGQAVHFFDMDQTKPLMRSRDAESLLEKAGVTVHFERQSADAPTQAGGLIPLLLEVDGDTCRFQQAFRVAGAHQGFGLVQVEEVDFPSLRCQLQRQVDGQLGLSAAGFAEKDGIRLPMQRLPCHGIHLGV